MFNAETDTTKPGVLDYLDAQIRSRVGTFLQLKSSLIDLTKASNPAISKRALELLQTQNQLEGSLTETTALIDKLKAGGMGYLEMVSAGVKINNFSQDMEHQITNTHQLQDQYKGIIPTSQGFLNTDKARWIVPVLIASGLLVGGIYVFGGTKRKVLA
jgi:hypothetical protein